MPIGDHRDGRAHGRQHQPAPERRFADELMYFHLRSDSELKSADLACQYANIQGSFRGETFPQACYYTPQGSGPYNPSPCPPNSNLINQSTLGAGNYTTCPTSIDGQYGQYNLDAVSISSACVSRRDNAHRRSTDANGIATGNVQCQFQYFQNNFGDIASCTYNTADGTGVNNPSYCPAPSMADVLPYFFTPIAQD